MCYGFYGIGVLIAVFARTSHLTFKTCFLKMFIFPSNFSLVSHQFLHTYNTRLCVSLHWLHTVVEM